MVIRTTYRLATSVILLGQRDPPSGDRCIAYLIVALPPGREWSKAEAGEGGGKRKEERESVGPENKVTSVSAPASPDTHPPLPPRPPESHVMSMDRITLSLSHCSLYHQTSIIHTLTIPRLLH